MSILNVNTIQPVGSGQTITVSATDLKIGSTTLKSSGGGTFIGNLTGNVTGNINSTGVSTVTTLQGSSNTISIPTGHRVVGVDTGSVYSPGSVVQTAVSYSPDTVGEITTTSSSYVTTGLSVTITPKYSTSKLFFTAVFNGKFVNGSGDDGAAFKVYRDGSAIRSGANDQLLYRSDANTVSNHIPVTIQHYVNANSTSSTTFTLFFSDQWGGTAIVNRDWGVPMLSVMEIAQ